MIFLSKTAYAKLVRILKGACILASLVLLGLLALPLSAQTKAPEAGYVTGKMLDHKVRGVTSGRRVDGVSDSPAPCARAF